MADISPIDLQKALHGADYPADLDQLVQLARKNGADDHLIQRLQSAGQKRFDGPNDVSKALFSGS